MDLPFSLNEMAFPLKQNSFPPSSLRADLMADVRAAFHDPSYAPPVTPAVAMEVMAMSRRPNVSLDDLAHLCERDPLVAARALRIAQSAYFSRGSRITSLRDAIVRVGVQTLADLFLAETMTTRVFRAPGYDPVMASLRRHSAMTAHIARALAAPMSQVREQVFLCALLHDVGIAAAAYVIGTRVPFHVAWPVILQTHAEAGQAVCRAWKLPAEIEIVATYHHGGRVGVTLHPGACVVIVAEWIANEIGFGLEGDTRAARPETELRLLGIDEATIHAVMIDARNAAARIA
jgi:putative nucleotidyltransferase with HDIG domain